MENEIVISEIKPLTALQIRENVNLIQEIMEEVMQGPSEKNPEGIHYGIIPGCKKPSLYKAGAEKLSMVFRLRPIIDNDRDIAVNNLPDDHKEITVYCHILSASGLELATGIGFCSTRESKFRYRGGEKEGTGQVVPTEYWNLKKVGKNKEAQDLIGGNGFGTGKIDGGWQICKIGSKLENPDIADTYNTVLKMAKKRAYVDGILSATGASDIFTQDVEDLPDNLRKNNPAICKVEVAVDMPKEKPATATPQEPVWGDEKLVDEPKEDVLPDDDKPVISEAQGKRLYAIYKSNGYNDGEVAEYLRENYAIKSTREIKKAHYDKIVAKFSTPK